MLRRFTEGSEEGVNTAFSPISVYMGLALASEAASDDTRAEVLDALGVSYEALNEKFAQWFRSFVREKKDDKTRRFPNYSRPIPYAAEKI